MVIFWPRNLGIWGDHFDFHPSITLITKAKTDHQVFRNRQELVEFIGGFIDLNNPEFPLQFNASPPDSIYVKGHDNQGEHFVVKQWSVIGWARDDYK